MKFSNLIPQLRYCAGWQPAASAETWTAAPTLAATNTAKPAATATATIEPTLLGGGEA